MKKWALVAVLFVAAPSFAVTEYKQTKKCFELDPGQVVSVQEQLLYIQLFNNDPQYIRGKHNDCHVGVVDDYYQGVEFGCDSYKPEVATNLAKGTGIAVPLAFKYRIGLRKDGACEVTGQAPARTLKSANLTVKYYPGGLGYPSGNLVWRIEKGSTPNEFCLEELALVDVSASGKYVGKKLESTFSVLKGGRHTSEGATTDTEIAQLQKDVVKNPGLQTELTEALRIRDEVTKQYKAQGLVPVKVNLPFYAGHADLVDTLIQEVGTKYQEIRKNPAERKALLQKAKSFSNDACANDEYRTLSSVFADGAPVAGGTP